MYICGVPSVPQDLILRSNYLDLTRLILKELTSPSVAWPLTIINLMEWTRTHRKAIPGLKKLFFKNYLRETEGRTILKNILT